MEDFLADLVEAKLLDANIFQMPKYISSFRDAEPCEASKTDEAWKRQILKILDKKGIPNKDLTIKITGNYRSFKDKLTEKDLSYRTELKAEISGFDSNYLPKLKEIFNGSSQTIGCGKVHLKEYYDQVIAMPSVELFEGLEEEYTTKVTGLRQEYPRISFTTVSHRVKNSQKIIISARSPNKEDLFKPQRIISALFTPKPVQLQSHEFIFLDKTQ